MLSRSKVLLAFDAGSVQAATVVHGLRSRRFTASARRALPEGALRPAALESNLARADDVRQAARAVVLDLQGAGQSGVVVLPDGVARIVMVDVPGGTDPREFARFRLGAQLPYPAAEAVVDAAPLGGGRHLAAAVRREIVAEYEDLAKAAGLVDLRVDLTPLAALSLLAASRRRAPAAPDMDVVLGESAYSLALFGGAAPLAFRNRRRDPGPGDTVRIAREIERTALLAAAGPAHRVRVVGAGARGMADGLRREGIEALDGWAEASLADTDAGERAWLAAGLA